MTRLLVVDDNEQNRYMAQVLLDSHGYEVELAVNGAEALQKARNAAPDLIITDILMPVMDGFALCREWRMDDRLKSIPFIFYTATYTDPEDEKFGLSLGADRFIVKPVSPEVLTETIREVLEQSRTAGATAGDRMIAGEDVYLKQHNQALGHKLEDKLAQLEKANRNLAAEIDERKAAEDKMCTMEKQLLQSQKMEAIGTLAGGIAHDFNNILLAIMGYSEIALINGREGRANTEQLEEVLKACQRAKELVNQILAFSRQSEVDRKPVQIKTVIKDALKLLRPSLPATIDIQPQLDSDALILADPTQVFQVVMNLCTNAAHAMQDTTGTLAVTLTEVVIDAHLVDRNGGLPPGDYLKLTVSDTGMGIPPELLTRIFDPYFTTKEKGEGTGLGLSVVHGIVKDIGGTINVDSQPGRGSTFRVYFPVIDRHSAMDAPVGEALQMGREQILFVEDEPPLIDIGTTLLEKLGYQVTACSEGASALALFRERPESIDLVITDMTMPGMTGEILARELMKIRPNLPVILCTGFGNRVTEKKARQAGIRALLMKPFVLNDLAKTIRRALEIEN